MLLRALDRKLLREVTRMRGQLATIALVLASGITCFVALRGTFEALEDARAAYYDRTRFADIFAHLERAPETLAARLEALPGVKAVQTRVVEDVSLPIEGMERPASGKLLSLPDAGGAAANDLRLQKGRLPERDRDDEV